MSGGEWVHRGLRVQAIMCLLEAFDEDNKWINFSYDPEFDKNGADSEKIDIQWEYESEDEKTKFVKIVQVKSSKNKVGTTAIKAWCDDLSASDGDLKELRLVCPGTKGDVITEHNGVQVPQPFVLDLKVYDDAVSHRVRDYFEREFSVYLNAAEALLVQESLETKLFKSVLKKEKYSRAKLREILSQITGIRGNEKISLLDQEIKEIEYFKKLFSYDEVRMLRPAILKFYFWTSDKFKPKDIKTASRFYCLDQERLCIKITKTDKAELCYLVITSLIVGLFFCLLLWYILSLDYQVSNVLKLLGVATIGFLYGLIMKSQFMPIFIAKRIQKALNE
jgi:hypothetical protein